jgi:lipopolysaccharide export system permease protein
MRLGRTLWLYFAFSFAKVILAIFALCFVLVAVIDYIEFARQVFSRANLGAGQALLISLMRVPSIAEAVLPFATLFGAIAALAIANRRLELVVTRSTGLSAWQFLMPGAVVGLLLGVCASLFYNPLASYLQRRSVELNVSLMTGKQASTPSTAWLYQNGRDGSSIVSAAQSADQGLRLADVSAFVFDADGSFKERVDASQAVLENGAWSIGPGVVTKPGSNPEPTENYVLATPLSATQIREAMGDPNAVSFWELPQLIQLADEAALPADKFRLRFQRLLAQPLLLMAMVLIAGVVSLRFSRLNRLGPMILAGVSAGFVLYVVNEITRDLGASGLVSPAIAAWLPAILSTLISVSFLLRQEDG